MVLGVIRAWFVERRKTERLARKLLLAAHGREQSFQSLTKAQEVLLAAYDRSEQHRYPLVFWEDHECGITRFEFEHRGPNYIPQLHMSAEVIHWLK